MKYTGFKTRSGHKLFIRERETHFDAKDITQSKFKQFSDHKEMKTWEYAAFQKEQFQQIKKRKKRFWTLVLISCIIAGIFILLVPIITSWLSDLNMLNF